MILPALARNTSAHRAIFMRAGAVTPAERIERELAELVEGPVDTGPSVQ